MKVNYVLMYGTPYLKYREFETFENVSKFLINTRICDYSIFKKLEDKEEVEMIYRDNDIRYLENEVNRLNNIINELEEYILNHYIVGHQIQNASLDDILNKLKKLKEGKL